MKFWRSISILWLLVGGLSPLAHSADVSTTTLRGQIADWSFIQSVGGLQIGKTLQEKQFAWSMEIFCDLSGHQTFTQRPTTVDSGMIIQKTLVEAKGYDIFISLVTSPVIWTSNPDKAKCKGVTIESTAGFKNVYYRDATGKTYPLRQVEFNNDSAVLNQNPG
jgi:hypothetical protein